MTEHVLLVEEDAHFGRVLRAVLEAGGYDVVSVANPLEARSAAIQHPPAVAIVSMETRQGSAESFVRALAEESPETQCILLALPSSLERMVDLYDLGTVYNHCWKPLDEIGDLARHVSRAMERRALKRQNAHLLAELRDARDDLRSMSEFLIQVERLAAVGKLFAAVGSSAAQSVADQPSGGTDPVARLARLAETSSDNWGVVDVEEVLSDALGMVAGSLEAASIRVGRIAGPDHALAFACRPQLTQAILHVLLNSLDAMPDGGALSVSCGREVGAQDGVRIVIRDSGPGIQPEVLPRIFDPFYTTGRFGERTGLGLSSARAIIRQHDGEISIETALGEGTTVRIWLPALVAVAVDTTASSLREIPLLAA